MSIIQGVRQRCATSPHLFAIHTDIIIRELGDMEDFRISGTVVSKPMYAEDTVILAEL